MLAASCTLATVPTAAAQDRRRAKAVVTVSGSIGEIAQGTANKSISAGFKRSW
jgi:hypothetical protein